MKLFIIPGLFCGISALLLVVQGCPGKFKASAEEEYMNTTLQCKLKLKLSSEDFPSIDDLNRNPDIDDKCMSKCMLEKFEVVDKDGLFDRDVFYDFLEENAPKPLLSKLTEIVNKCADTTEIDKVEKSKEESKTKVPDVIPCETYHAFQVCFTVNAEKLC